jgi:alginate O-acetyltransferase complex protein AlgI
VALLGWAAMFYGMAPRLSRGDVTAKALFFCLLASIIGYLAWFKYMAPRWGPSPPPPPLIPQFFYDPGAYQYVIPLGISYFTFKLIHYAIERARGNIGSHSPGSFLLYLTFFPAFPAGPIERFENFLAHRDARWTPASTIEGLGRIQRGLVKKFFIAECLVLPLIQQPSTPQLLGALDQVPALLVWWHLAGAFAYAYLDFAGYSDIAIGAARLFGFKLCENFNSPLLAANLGDFWKRWHMSLSGWCQAYVYMPMLGWTRNPYLATYACMAVIGLWHAGTPNWLFWGMYHATGLAIFLTWARTRRRRNWCPERFFLYQLGARLVTLLFVAASYAFVVTDKHGGLSAAFRILAKLLGVDVAR